MGGLFIQALWSISSVCMAYTLLVCDAMQYFIAYLENKALTISFLIASVKMLVFPLRKSIVLGLNPFGQLNCLVQSLMIYNIHNIIMM